MSGSETGPERIEDGICRHPSHPRNHTDWWGTGLTAADVVTIDCHVHTRGSFDCSEPTERVLESAAKANVDGIVVTDHDCLSNSLVAAERASDYGLIGIPGVEVSTAEGHVLAIGVETCPASEQPFAETVTEIRNDGGLAVVPHPFQRTRHGVSSSAITDCDGIEVFNAHTLTGLRNRQASKYAANHRYPRFGGSDAHKAENVGRAYTAVSVDAIPPTTEDVLTAMRSGRTRAIGKRLSKRQYVRKLAQNAKRNSAEILPVG